MEKIRELRLKALDSMGFTVAEIQKLLDEMSTDKNDFDAEARVYVIHQFAHRLARAAKRFHEDMHTENSKDHPHLCEQQSNKGVFDYIFGKGTLPFVLMIGLLGLGGCRGVDRLLGNNDDPAVVAPAGPVSALGDWSGSGVLAGDITINGHLAIMTMDIPTQVGAAASGTWQLLLDNSNAPGGPPPTLIGQGAIAGTIDAAGLFTYTLTETPSCPAESHGTGQISGNSMAVNWTGTGNPACALWFDGGSGTLTR